MLLLFGHEFLLAFGASENTIEYADNYLNIYAFGTLFVELTLGMNAFITAQGFATTGMMTAGAGAGRTADFQLQLRREKRRARPADVLRAA